MYLNRFPRYSDNAKITRKAKNKKKNNNNTFYFATFKQEIIGDI